MTTNLEWAERYAAYGWPVLPLKPGEKVPASEHGVKDATTDARRIKTWFTDPTLGVGLATGHEFFVVDIDPRNDGTLTWNMLCAKNNAPDLMWARGIERPATLSAATGGNGMHLLFKMPDEDFKNGSIGDGVDIKGKGGYIVAEPSIHPNGRAYRWTDPDVDEDIADAPQWLIDMLPRRVTTIRDGGASNPYKDDPNDDRPGSVYNRTATWEDVLIPAGWSVERVDGNEIMWTRPGKSSGISASTGYDGMDILYVFTSSTEFEAQSAYTKFAAYATLYHDGDFSAAAKELAAVSVTKSPGGFRVPPPEDVYTFSPAAPPDSFIGRYVGWANEHTDAASEYHEAAALMLLAVASSKCRGMLATYPDGLPANLYLLLCGTTTRSRKSTSQKLGISILRESYPVAPLPSRATTERLIGILAEKSYLPTVWGPDEFGIKLGEIYSRDFLQGLEELMLTLYDCEDYKYEKQDRSVTVESPFLNILAAATPESLAMAGPGAMVGGLLPRFGIVFPAALPAPREMGEYVDLEPQKQWLVSYLKDILRWSSDNKDIRFSREALGILGPAETKLHAGGAAVARLATMLYKVSMLVAIGRMDTTVTEDDALVAQQIVNRWYAGARRLQPFLRRKSVDLEFDSQAENALRILKSLGDGPHHRSEVARKLRIQKSKLDAIQGALVDWGFINVNAGMWEVAEDD